MNTFNFERGEQKTSEQTRKFEKSECRHAHEMACNQNHILSLIVNGALTALTHRTVNHTSATELFPSPKTENDDFVVRSRYDNSTTTFSSSLTVPFQA